jgi:ferredoxin/flavodoxin---NADP+ reductase
MKAGYSSWAWSSHRAAGIVASMSAALAPAAAEALKSRFQPFVIDRVPDAMPAHLGVFRLRPQQGELPAYQAGQYVTLAMDTPEGLVARPYSVASSPLDRDAYELYVVRVDGGALTPALFAAPAGTRVWVGPPKGHFTLAAAAARTVVMVATGTGLAPFLSQIRTLFRLHAVGVPAGYRVVLMHGCAFADEFSYRDELRRYADERGDDFDFTYLTTASRADEGHGWSPAHGAGRVNELFRCLFDLPTDARRRVGLPEGVDKRHLRDLIRGEPAALMVCGNPGMIDDLREPARQLGMGGFMVEEYWKA